LPYTTYVVAPLTFFHVSLTDVFDLAAPFACSRLKAEPAGSPLSAVARAAASAVSAETGLAGDTSPLTVVGSSGVGMGAGSAGLSSFPAEPPLVELAPPISSEDEELEEPELLELLEPLALELELAPPEPLALELEPAPLELVPLALVEPELELLEPELEPALELLEPEPDPLVSVELPEPELALEPEDPPELEEAPPVLLELELPALEPELEGSGFAATVTVIAPVHGR